MRGATPLQVLRRWRQYVRIVHRAVRSAVPEAEVYVAGGAAEGRLTVMSDVDVLVVLPRALTRDEAVEVRARVMERAEELGLPLYAPVELHVISGEELEEYARRGRVVPADRV